MKPTDQQINDIAMSLHCVIENRRVSMAGKRPLFTSHTELTEIIIDQWETVRPPDPAIKRQAAQITKLKAKLKNQTQQP